VTSKDRVFLLDANIFIEAKRRYYAFDLCPGFWESIKALHEDKRLYSIDRIKDELEKGGDDLAEWACKEMPAACFLSTDNESITGCYGQIVSWVSEQDQFLDAAKAEFASDPDGWLIACACARQLAIVTHEVYSPDAQRRVHIPNVCRQFGVEYFDTFKMLRELHVRFHWKSGG